MQATIVGGDVSQQKAREAFLAYRTLVRQGRATEDDETLMRAYKVIATGKRVLDLRETLKIGGLDDLWKPRLAIARADLPRIQFTRHWRLNRWCYIHDARGNVRSAASGKLVPVAPGVYPQLDDRSHVAFENRRLNWSTLNAAVPPIPAALRPPKEELHQLHILWEVKWDPIPPGDPILLKRIGAYLYAVLAQWDLSELERAVLGARLS